MGECFFSTRENGQELKWLTKDLWKLSSELEPFDYAIENFDLEQDVWFHDMHTPSVELVLEHMRRVQEADLSFPIILAQDGAIMDGVHRLCKAKLLGLETVKAVQFKHNPVPNEILIVGG